MSSSEKVPGAAGRARRTLWLFGRAVGPAVVIALIAAGLYAVTCFVLDPGLLTVADAASMWAVFAVVHLAALIPLVALSTLYWARSTEVASAREVWLSVAGLAVSLAVVVNLMLRFTLTYTVLHAGSPFISPLGALNIVVFALVGVLLIALLPLARLGRARPVPRLRLGIAAAIAFGCIGLNVWSEQVESPALPEFAGPDAAESGAPAVRPNRVVLLGLDGLNWSVLKDLIARGKLPAFDRMLREGSRALLHTEIPTQSPRIWTTIATGRDPASHGITGFSHYQLPGMDGWLSRGPLVLSANWLHGMNRVISGAARLGWIDQRPVGTPDRRVAAVWDVAHQFALTVGVADWYASWPAYDLGPGSYMVSNLRAAEGAEFPERASRQALRGRRAPLLRISRSVRPGVRELLQQNDARMYRSLALYESHRPFLTLSYSHALDTLQHVFWRGDQHGQLLEWREERLTNYAPEIVEAYIAADRWLGWHRGAATEDTLFFVVSDHGYMFNGHEHHHAPPGVLMVAGAGVAPGGTVRDPSIYDIAPTILAVLGLPIADELEGRVLVEMFRPGALRPQRQVPTYAWFQPVRSEAKRSRQLEQDEMERLRALGYVP